MAKVSKRSRTVMEHSATGNVGTNVDFSMDTIECNHICYFEQNLVEVLSL